MLASVWLARSCSGGLRKVFIGLALWQVAMIVVTLRSHGLTERPSAMKGDATVLDALAPIMHVVGAWSISLAVGRLGLFRGQLLWGRLAKVITAAFVVLVALTLAVGTPLGGGVPRHIADATWLNAGLLGVLLALMAVTVCLFIYACLATRSEAAHAVPKGV